MSQVEEPGDAAGGAPKRPKKSAALTIRMTQETRSELEAAARREHRSVSEVAELWITAAARGQAEYREKIGGSQVADAIEALLRFKNLVAREIGDPRVYLPARDALLTGWKAIIDKALPYTPDTADGERFRLHRASLVVLCRAAMAVLLDESEGDEALTAFGFERPPTNTLNLLAGGSAQPSFYRVLQWVAENPNRNTATLLKMRLEGASEVPAALAPLIKEIREVLPKFVEADDAYMKPRREHSERGMQLADSMIAVPHVDG